MFKLKRTDKQFVLKLPLYVKKLKKAANLTIDSILTTITIVLFQLLNTIIERIPYPIFAAIPPINLPFL